MPEIFLKQKGNDRNLIAYQKGQNAYTTLPTFCPQVF